MKGITLSLNTMSLSRWKDSQAVVPFMLDYSSALAAYGLRKLNRTYRGSSIRVRRSSDNAELNIGFDRYGNLNIGDLMLFAGIYSLRIVTWYDQSGNNRHITQNNYFSQPVIVEYGIIRQANGRPAMYFDKTQGQFLSRTDSFVFNAGEATILTVAAAQAAPNMWIVTEGSIFGISPIYCPLQTDATVGDTPARYQRNDFNGASNMSNVRNGSQIAFDGQLKAISSVDYGNRFVQYVNGNLSSDQSYERVGSCTLDTFAVGGLVQAPQPRLFYTGYVSELIIYPSLINNLTRQSLEEQQKIYFSIS